MTAENDTRARIKRVIVESLMLEGLAPEDIEDDQALFGEGLGLDSVDALELVLGLENEFGIKIKSDELGRDAFASVATLSAWLARHRPEAVASVAAEE